MLECLRARKDKGIKSGDVPKYEIIPECSSFADPNSVCGRNIPGMINVVSGMRPNTVLASEAYTVNLKISNHLMAFSNFLLHMFRYLFSLHDQIFIPYFCLHSRDEVFSEVVLHLQKEKKNTREKPFLSNVTLFLRYSFAQFYSSFHSFERLTDRQTNGATALSNVLPKPLIY